MNDNLARKFCESRYRWPIVATATALFAVTVLLPQADDYFDKSTTRNSLADDVAAARDTAKSLPNFERRVADVEGRLAALDVRAVDEAGLPRYRSRLVEIVREAQCQIRRIEVGPTTTRPWKLDDEPLTETPPPATPDTATPFSLERRSVLLSVDGAMPAIHDLLDRLEKERIIGHAHRVQLQSASGSGSTVTLEIELWLFALTNAST